MSLNQRSVEFSFLQITRSSVDVSEAVVGVDLANRFHVDLFPLPSE
jgi:hypothetical protein